MKTYARRDSVTAVLRKMGIDKADYHKYIQCNYSDGTFTLIEPTYITRPVKDVESKICTDCSTVLPPVHLNQTNDGILHYEHHRATDPKSIAIKDNTKKSRRTVSSAAREYILAGHDNKKVFDLLKKEFGLDDSKKSYPCWYRSDMKRKNQI